MSRRALAQLVSPFGLVTIAFLGLAQEQPVQPPGVEVQARGPVHEAFAAPIADRPEQGAVIPKAPPEPIEELPPEQKPDGDNVQWIPGYWAWDADQSDFLWVSGCWRVPPPGRHWVPGHWQEIDKGWLWDSGFWAPDNLQQVQYLPPPPPPPDAAVPPAPNPESTYVGGCWVYQNARYLWRPGFWLAYRPGWVWIPAHYIWTPVGCLFVDGYWDHPLDERGLLFAPIRFDMRAWLAARRPFIPELVIHTDFLLGALFVGPHTRHYYFGDYFEDRYAKRGFVAWTDYRPRKDMFDPNFAYFRHLHAAEPRWEASLRELYNGRRTGAVLRPPHTLIEQVRALKTIAGDKTMNGAVTRNINLTHVQNVTALAPLREVPNFKMTSLGALSPGRETKVAPHEVKLVAVPKAEYVREQKVAAQARDLGLERRATEAKLLVQGGVPVKHTDPATAVKFALPAPPPHVTAPPAARGSRRRCRPCRRTWSMRSQSTSRGCHRGRRRKNASEQARGTLPIRQRLWGTFFTCPMPDENRARKKRAPQQT